MDNENKKNSLTVDMFKADWTLRRKIIYWTLACSFAIIIWGMSIEKPTTLHEVILEGVIALDMAIMISWVLGAVVEDGFSSFMKSKSAGGTSE